MQVRSRSTGIETGVWNTEYVRYPRHRITTSDPHPAGGTMSSDNIRYVNGTLALTVTVSSGTVDHAAICRFNMLGQRIIHTDQKIGPGTRRLTVTAPFCAPEIYLCRVTTSAVGRVQRVSLRQP